MLKPANVATPPAAATVVVPANTPPGVPLPAVIASVTGLVAAVTTLLLASSTRTATAGVIGALAVVVVGFTEY